VFFKNFSSLHLVAFEIKDTCLSKQKLRKKNVAEYASIDILKHGAASAAIMTNKQLANFCPGTALWR
jgi:hypothetical protein